MTADIAEEVIDSPETEVVGLAIEKLHPIAVVEGKPVTQLPLDLYIPPHALEVFLEAFEGPLDLLLYLIKRQNLDILNIPIAEITKQYVDYITLMKDLSLELAAEYLVMAAMLAEIKSRMLLPRVASEEEEEELDPRAELVRRLQEYERIKRAAEDIDALPRYERDIFPAWVDLPEMEIEQPLPQVDLRELLVALSQILQRADANASHHIQKETLSVRECMSHILSMVKPDEFIEFSKVLPLEQGRVGVVASFIAVLELMKQSLIEMVQAEPYGPIHIKAVSTDEQ